MTNETSSTAPHTPGSEPASSVFWESDRPHIPDYRLLRLIGRGGFGDVWLAETRGGLWVAVKILRAEAKDSIELHGLLNYRAYAQGHPNLIQVHHVGEAASRPYYVMELGDSYPCNAPQNPEFYRPRTVRGDLERSGPYALGPAVEVVEAVLSGLDRLHTEGLLHRDVKPGNILFVGGEPKLGDLGLLAEADETPSRACTPAYAPPEGVIDRGGDLHCLGRTLYEMITGGDPMRYPVVPADLTADARAGLERLRPLLARACASSSSERLTSTDRFRSTLAECTKRDDERRIGRYRLIRALGEGQFGAVYLARQDEPCRSVALKLMKRGVASRSALSRFRYEARTLGRLRHPHIAQVYEAGTHDDGLGGVPYFVMEYVEKAKPLTDHAASRELGTRARLELFVKICDAVHHGHQKGVIHRDLKPENILVDGRGEPKIIDFGVARATDTDVATTTLRTGVGELVGTLQYMSPEQCKADPEDLDTRSDVYALGVVLYELLSGRLPYDLDGKAVFEAARMIREAAPTRLSAVDCRLCGDLETITLKALDKERDGRYASAADLGDDLRRYLRSEPIVARKRSSIYSVRLFARRNRAAFASIVLVSVTMIAATAVSLAFAFRAGQARQSEAQAKDEATRQRDIASDITRYVTTQLLGAAKPSVAGGRERSFREAVMEVAAGLDASSYPPEVESQLRSTFGSMLLEFGEYEAARAHLERGRHLQESLSGNESTEMADILVPLALALAEDGHDVPRAIELIDRAAELRRGQLGPEDDRTISATAFQAMLRAQLDRRAEAILSPIQLQIIAGIAQKPVSEVRVYYERLIVELDRRWARGERHAVQDRLRRELQPALEKPALAEGVPKSCPYFARSLSDRFPGFAEALATTVVGISRERFGDESLNTAFAMGVLGEILLHQGRLDEAEPWCVAAVEHGRKIVTPQHIALQQGVRNLVDLWGRQGRYEEARNLLRDFLLDLETAKRPRFKGWFTMVTTLAQVERDDGRLPEAARLYTRVRDRAQVTLGTSHPWTLSSMLRLANVEHERGRYAVARDQAKAVLDIATGLEQRTAALELLVQMAEEEGEDAAAVAWRAQLEATRK